MAISTTKFPRPRLSIGLPVRNGEPDLPRSIESLLEQSFEDFELIVVDNCSTDNTTNILERYQQQDSRVQLHRNATNIGQLANFDRALQLSSAQYFMWASADDFWDEEFASSLIYLLDTSPKIDAAIGAISRVTPSNEFIDVVRFHDLQPFGRGSKLANALRIAAGYSNRKRYHLLLYSIFRRDFLAMGLPYSSIQTVYPDRTFMCQYALFGTFGYVDKPLMSKTVQSELASSRYPGEFQFEDRDSAPWGLSHAAFAVVPFLFRSPLVPAYKLPLVLLIAGAMLWGYRFELYRGTSRWMLPFTLPLKSLRRVARLILRRKWKM